MDKAHRPEAGLLAGATAPAQMDLDDAQKDSQDGAEGLRFALPLISIGQRSRFGTERTHWRTGSSGMT